MIKMKKKEEKPIVIDTISQEYYERLAESIDDLTDKKFALWYLLKNYYAPYLYEQCKDLGNERNLEEYREMIMANEMYKQCKIMIECLYFEIWG